MKYKDERYYKPENNKVWWKSHFGVACVFFFVVAGYFLIMEHRAHIGDNWIWLILLACPLVHVFMHRSHDEHHHSNKEEK